MLSAISQADLDAILVIEQAVQAFPWPRSHFCDALTDTQYQTICLRDTSGKLIGYAILFAMLDDMHLLNLAVAPEVQRTGQGQILLNAVCGSARAQRCTTLLLEVRVSNHAARRFYERAGFSQIGRRANYYPAPAQRREDALVLQLALAPSPLY